MKSRFCVATAVLLVGLGCSWQTSTSAPAARGRTVFTSEPRSTQANKPRVAAPKPATLSRLRTFEHVPVGVAVSKDDRVFFAFSRAIDETVPYSVVELRGTRAVQFPPGFAQDGGEAAANRLLSVQALTVDADNRLWILDTGKVGTNQIEPGTAKLVGWDLDANKHVRTIELPAAIAGPTAFVNDVRVDMGRGNNGMAVLTDASAEGPNALIVVDLASGNAVRRLNDHPSTRPDPEIVLEVDGQALYQKAGPAMGMPLRLGADGLAFAGDWVYYCPLASHQLYRIAMDDLFDLARSDAALAEAVEDLGDKGFAADGLLGDTQGNLYVTDFEHDIVRRRSPAGAWTVAAKGPGLRWPDTLALKSDGTLVITSTQIADGKRVQGWDQRERPFRVFQMKTRSSPVFED